MGMQAQIMLGMVRAPPMVRVLNLCMLFMICRYLSGTYMMHTVNFQEYWQPSKEQICSREHIHLHGASHESI